MMSQLPRFRCLYLSCQQQKNTKNGAAVTSLMSFVFCDDFSNVARGGVPPPPVGAFYSTKIWVGNCPPCPPVTDPPVRNRFCEKYVASILTETKKNY